MFVSTFEVVYPVQNELHQLDQFRLPLFKLESLMS